MTDTLFKFLYERLAEAERSVLVQHGAYLRRWRTNACATCPPPRRRTPLPWRNAWPCQAALVLAAPYAKDPDYRRKWRP